MSGKHSWHTLTIPGDGEALQCEFHWLHGWGHDHTALKRLAELFTGAPSHTLYDLPGFGKTPPLQISDKAGANTRDYADNLAAQLDPDKKHILVGHSYGARVSVQLAAAYPDLVKAIILISGAGLKRRRSFKFRMRALLLRQLGKGARTSDKLFGTTFYKTYANRFGSTDYKNAGDMRPVLVSAVNEDLSCIARSVACPALLLYGSDDTETPPEIGRRYENLIPIARFEELKGYDHNDILSRGAYQCEALIKAFLEDLRHDR